MAMDDPVSKPQNGFKIGSDPRRSQVSDVQANPSGPRGEFSKLRHYVKQMRGLRLDTEA